MTEELVVQKTTPLTPLTHTEATEKYKEAENLFYLHRPANPVSTRWARNDTFLAEIKNYPLIEFINKSKNEYDNQVYSIKRVKTGIIGSTTTGFVASTALTLIFGVSLMSLAPLLVGGILAVCLDSRFYDGSNRNPLRSFFCKMFLGKKSKQKAREYHKNALLYTELQKPFKLLLESKIAELQEQDVFRIMNLNNRNKPWAFNEYGNREILAQTEYHKFLFNHTNHKKKHDEIIDGLIEQYESAQETSNNLLEAKKSSTKSLEAKGSSFNWQM